MPNSAGETILENQDLCDILDIVSSDDDSDAGCNVPIVDFTPRRTHLSHHSKQLLKEKYLSNFRTLESDNSLALRDSRKSFHGEEEKAFLLKCHTASPIHTIGQHISQPLDATEEYMKINANSGSPLQDDNFDNKIDEYCMRVCTPESSYSSKENKDSIEINRSSSVNNVDEIDGGLACSAASSHMSDRFMRPEMSPRKSGLIESPCSISEADCMRVCTPESSYSSKENKDSIEINRSSSVNNVDEIDGGLACSAASSHMSDRFMRPEMSPRKSGLIESPCSISEADCMRVCTPESSYSSKENKDSIEINRSSSVNNVDEIDGGLACSAASSHLRDRFMRPKVSPRKPGIVGISHQVSFSSVLNRLGARNRSVCESRLGVERSTCGMSVTNHRTEHSSDLPRDLTNVRDSTSLSTGRLVDNDICRTTTANQVFDNNILGFDIMTAGNGVSLSFPAIGKSSSSSTFDGSATDGGNRPYMMQNSNYTSLEFEHIDQNSTKQVLKRERLPHQISESNQISGNIISNEKQPLVRVLDDKVVCGQATSSKAHTDTDAVRDIETISDLVKGDVRPTHTNELDQSFLSVVSTVRRDITISSQSTDGHVSLLDQSRSSIAESEYPFFSQKSLSPYATQPSLPTSSEMDDSVQHSQQIDVESDVGSSTATSLYIRTKSRKIKRLAATVKCVKCDPPYVQSNDSEFNGEHDSVYITEIAAVSKKCAKLKIIFSPIWEGTYYGRIEVCNGLKTYILLVRGEAKARPIALPYRNSAPNSSDTDGAISTSYISRATLSEVKSSSCREYVYRMFSIVCNDAYCNGVLVLKEVIIRNRTTASLMLSVESSSDVVRVIPHPLNGQYSVSPTSDIRINVEIPKQPNYLDMRNVYLRITHICSNCVCRISLVDTKSGNSNNVSPSFFECNGRQTSPRLIRKSQILSGKVSWGSTLERNLSTKKTMETGQRIYPKDRIIDFGDVSVGSLKRLKAVVCNSMDKEVMLFIQEPDLPFVVSHTEIKVLPKSYVRLPIRIIPVSSDMRYQSLLRFFDACDNTLLFELLLIGKSK